MAPFSPEAFGKYYLVDKIATGGMAEIFKAKTYSHGGFENLLVIKRILSHLGENDEFVEMFIDEAKLSVALQHPNIIRIYDFGKLGENYFIAMECVEGKDVRNVLRKLARKQRFLPVELCAYVAHEAAKGLDHAHRKTDSHGRSLGIVHRDISPSNLLVSYDGEIKIADFGIAKAESNAYQTRDGVLKGKFEYMSPEQATGKPLDHRSDIFSLGIILWEMLTGHRLFKEDNEILTLERIRGLDIRPPSEVNPRVPRALDDIVMKALSPRKQRYQWAHELQEDLREHLLPKTADALREALADFMRDAFSQEIDDELRRLEEGSHVAEQLHADALTEEWEGATESTMHRAPARRLWPLVLLALLFVTVPVALSAALVAVLWLGSAPAEQVAQTGSVDVMVLPAARVELDGREVGEGESLSLEDIEPGEHLLRLIAEGHEPIEEAIVVRAGEATRVARTLSPVEQVAEVVEDPDPQPRVAAPAVAVTTDPRGATVLVDGRAVGTSPVTWRGGRPGGSHRIEARLEGHRTKSATVRGLEAGGRHPVHLALEPVAAEPGALTVALIGGGWANVWVDGEKLPKTAPLSGFPVAAGTHEVRVENAALGLDSVQRIEVRPGETTVVRARPD